MDRIDYDLLYGEEDDTNYEDENIDEIDLTGTYEIDNAVINYDDYNYDYDGDEEEVTTEDPPTTEYPEEDDGAVIIGSVDISDDVTVRPVGPRTTTEPGALVTYLSYTNTYFDGVS